MFIQDTAIDYASLRRCVETRATATECGIHSIDLKCSFQTAPLTVETVGLDAKTAPTTNCQTPNCTNYYEKPTVPLVVEQLVGAPLPTLVLPEDASIISDAGSR